MTRRFILLWVLACVPCTATAQAIQLHGYLDARLQFTDTSENSWIDGGLGKTRYGANDGTALKLGAAALAGSWQITPELLAVADLQFNSQTSPDIGVLDAFLRYRPVSTTPWRWSVRVGAFFPPISLENDAIGWTSRWTLSPSAINSWVGEELRTIGAEFRLEHRSPYGTIEFGLAGIKNNDPAGELLASRGWSVGDVTSPLGASLREPDAYASVARSPAPLNYKPFTEIDGRLGWHSDLTWLFPGGGKLSLMRYDNRADPESYAMQDGRKVFSWMTKFWSLGGEIPIGRLVLIAQAMDGSTGVEPVPEFYLDTKLHAGYLLAGWDLGAWSPALRVDMFDLQQLPESLSDPLSEHGNAWTAALNWRPRPWLRVTGELLRIDSTRDQRRLEGLAPRQINGQLQLSLRLLF